MHAAIACINSNKHEVSLIRKMNCKQSNYMHVIYNNKKHEVKKKKKKRNDRMKQEMLFGKFHVKIPITL